MPCKVQSELAKTLDGSPKRRCICEALLNCLPCEVSHSLGIPRPSPARKRRARSLDVAAEEAITEVSSRPRQCFGPRCRNDQVTYETNQVELPRSDRRASTDQRRSRPIDEDEFAIRRIHTDVVGREVSMKANGFFIGFVPRRRERNAQGFVELELLMDEGDGLTGAL